MTKNVPLLSFRTLWAGAAALLLAAGTISGCHKSEDQPAASAIGRGAPGPAAPAAPGAAASTTGPGGAPATGGPPEAEHYRQMAGPNGKAPGAR